MRDRRLSRNVWFAVALSATWFVSIPATALAQANSGIAGVVRDSSGAVLPGVTVEAASPALIEKVRTVVSDEKGEYKILDLRPGTYTVTFSLPGFSTVKREGIELTANFTGNVNAELRVGSLEETVTVSGATPTVDVQNVIQQRTINKDIISAIPSGRTEQTVASVIPGMQIQAVSNPVTQDVGGSTGDMRQTLGMHGSKQADFNEMIEGVPMNAMTAYYTGGMNMDSGAVQEFTYEYGAVSAERSAGGVLVNIIPKDGGNRFTGAMFVSGSNQNFQSNNITPDLTARGVRGLNKLDKIWDANAGVGGPLKADRLWFYVSTRFWGYDNLVANTFANATQGTPVYTANLGQQAIDDSWLGSASLRPTWQASQRNKLSVFLIDQGRCLCHQNVGPAVTSTGTGLPTGITAPEAARRARSPVDNLEQITWTSTVTSRLLLEVSAQRYDFQQSYEYEPQVTPLDLAIVNLANNFNYNAAVQGHFRHNSWIHNYRGTASYVTGSHALKAGVTLQEGYRQYTQAYNQNVTLSVNNNAAGQIIPVSLTEYASPYEYDMNLDADLGIFAQDQWTLKRLTANIGLRFDYQHESTPAQNVPATYFLPVRSYPAVRTAADWKDLDPRVGLSYDLFGNGKTALKGSISRFVGGETIGMAAALNPVNTSVNSVTRPWTADPSGTLNPFLDCNLMNSGVNGSCGAITNASFGTPNTVTTFAPNLIKGFGVRPYNWEVEGGVQQEVARGISFNATYFRRWWGNFLVNQNTNWTAANFDPFCTTAPADPRLPGGGGYQVCGLYDINPSVGAQVNNVISNSNQFGNQWEHYNGVDVSLTARLPRSSLVQGGLNVGRDETNNCDVVSKIDNAPTATALTAVNLGGVYSPSLLYCDIKPPFQPQVKFLGTLGLPWKFTLSGVFQTLAGPQILASESLSKAQGLTATTLGRQFFESTYTIPLIAPGTVYGDRVYQIDFRLSKGVPLGHGSLRGNVNLYNLMNANPVLIQNNTYGQAWQQPQAVLTGRLLRFDATIDF
jgi:Carboxypeptidase regulatory-like domain